MAKEEAYRLLLLDLHTELSEKDRKSLIFLVQPLIKTRILKKIKDGFSLFQAMEECCYLSSGKLDFLSELLEFIGRLDLKVWIQEAMPWKAAEVKISLICPFRKLLYNLHTQIPDHDLYLIRYRFGKIPKRTTIADPLDLFEFMIHQHCLTPWNLDVLKNLFSEIQRADLMEHLLHFEDTVDPDECGYPKQKFGPRLLEASLDYSPILSSSSPGATAATGLTTNGAAATAPEAAESESSIHAKQLSDTISTDSTAQSANLPQPQYLEKETLAEVDSPTIKAPQQSERFELSDLHCSDGPVQSAIGEEEEKESLLCRYSQTALYFACNCSLLFVPTVWCRRL